ncbi:MAG: hypothetical protein GF334_06185 [Candidatus Altiarchaeales archaeon]|nr:hypothetical protein [Candidatus Altiarchaeales archaeon]
MQDLNKIRLGHSILTNKIYMYRYGKDERHALDKRDAEKDLFVTLVDYMMHGTPKGSTKKVIVDGVSYCVTVKPEKD